MGSRITSYKAGRLFSAVLSLVGVLLAASVWSGCGSSATTSPPSHSHSAKWAWGKFFDIEDHGLKPGTPNIKWVIANRSVGGHLTFRIVYAKPIHLTPGFGAEVHIDADRSGGCPHHCVPTGDQDGWDYDLIYAPGTHHEPPYLAMLVFTQGKEYEVTVRKAKSLRFHSAARSVTFEIDAHDLGASLAAQLKKRHAVSSLPELRRSFDFTTDTSAHWLDDSAGVDDAGYWTLSLD